MNEKREHKRFQLRNTIYASIKIEKNQTRSIPQTTHAVSRKNGPKITGQILNISSGGVAVSYIADTQQKGSAGEFFIQIGDENFRLELFPFVSLEDKQSQVPDPYSSIEMRLLRGKFGQLSSRQKAQLLSFIRDNALS